MFFHFHASTVKRSRGGSAVAAAAYIAGTTLLDLRQAVTHDYFPRDRAGAIYDRAIIHPNGAEWCSDRERLWNAAELWEVRCNSVTARQFELALPAVLPPRRMKVVAREIAGFISARFQVAVDIAIHRPRRTDWNWHVHFQLTTRQVTAYGLGAKTRVLDAAKTGGPEIVLVRGECARLLNRELRAIGVNEELSHLSFAARGIDRIPLVKLGKVQAALKRRGATSDAETLNQLIRETNNLGDAIQRDLAEATRLQAELALVADIWALHVPPGRRYGTLLSRRVRARGPSSSKLPARAVPEPTSSRALIIRPRSKEQRAAQSAVQALTIFVAIAQRRAAISPGGLDSAGLLELVADLAAESGLPNLTILPSMLESVSS